MKCKLCGKRLKLSAQGTMHPSCVDAKDAFRDLMRKHPEVKSMVRK